MELTFVERQRSELNSAQRLRNKNAISAIRNIFFTLNTHLVRASRRWQDRSGTYDGHYGGYRAVHGCEVPANTLLAAYFDAAFFYSDVHKDFYNYRPLAEWMPDHREISVPFATHPDGYETVPVWFDDAKEALNYDPDYFNRLQPAITDMMKACVEDYEHLRAKLTAMLKKERS